MQRLAAAAIGLLLNCCFLFAQEPTFLHYTVDDGLPSSHVYYVIQDSKGYIWFGTDKGLCRFDGYEYKTFTINDGLPYNDVWTMFEDSQERIWLASFGSEFSYIYNDSIVRIENPYKALSGQAVDQIIEDDSGNIWIPMGNQKVPYLFKYAGDSLKCIETKPQPYDSKRSSKETDFFFYRPNVNIIDNDSIFIYREIGFISKITEIIAPQDRSKKHRVVNQFHSKDSSVHFYNGYLYLSHLDSLTKIDVPIEHCTSYPASLKGTEDYIFKCDTSIVAFDKNLELTNKYAFLKQFKTRRLLEDQQNNLWIATDDKGVFMRPASSIYTQNYTNNQENFTVKSLYKTPNGTLWVGTDEGELYTLDKDKKKLVLTDIFTEQGQVLPSIIDMCYIEKERRLYFIFKDAYLRYINTDNREANNKFRFKVSEHRYAFPSNEKLNSKIITTKRGIGCFKSFGQQKSDTLLIQSCHGMVTWLKKDGEYELKWHKTGRGYGLANRNGEIWLGQTKGLFRFENNELDSLKELKQRYPILNKNIVELGLDKKNNLWIGTDGYGVFRLKNEILDTITALKGTIVKKIFIDENDEAWVTSNQGLYHINDQDNVRLYTTAEGLSSNEVNCVYVDNSNIYVGTNKGLTVIGRNESYQNNTPPPFHLRKLLIRGEEQTLIPDKKEYDFDLSYNQNSLKIEYICLSFESNQNIVYEYKLSGIDQEWKQTKELSKEYPILPYGQSYTLELRAKDINQTYSNDVYKLNFNISSPWWQTWWFRLSILALIAGLIIYRINRFRQKEKEKTLINKRFAELELNALQSQMNPHFIFNALQAIQDFVAGKDERAANKYMANFSKLMRLFLESSKEKYISLEEELKLLSLYMELEQLRFEPPFDFDIDCPESIDWGTVEIPSMLLQPFVENAVNHGLKYKKGQGFVKIKIREQNDRLIVRIIDNGVGIKKAKKIKEKATKSYKSRSMKIIEERIKTIQFVDQVEIKISVQDRLVNDEVQGTIVEIICPFFEKF